MLALVTNIGQHCSCAKSVVGSGKRPLQTTAWRFAYGVARTDTLIALLLAVAILAAIGGFAASAFPQKKRRARGPFLLGFVCGLTAGAILRGRRRGLNLLGALTGRADVRPLRAGIRRDTVRFAARALTCLPRHVSECCLGRGPGQHPDHFLHRVGGCRDDADVRMRECWRTCICGRNRDADSVMSSPGRPNCARTTP